MLVRDLFKKNINRHIEGVIKADDERDLLTEVDEYVVTSDVADGLDERDGHALRLGVAVGDGLVVVFALGGALGHADAVADRVGKRLALSERHGVGVGLAKRHRVESGHAVAVDDAVDVAELRADAHAVALVEPHRLVDDVGVPVGVGARVKDAVRDRVQHALAVGDAHHLALGHRLRLGLLLGRREPLVDADKDGDERDGEHDIFSDEHRV